MSNQNKKSRSPIWYRFRRLRRRGSPPAKIRKGGGTARMTISSFSLAANKFEFAKQTPSTW